MAFKWHPASLAGVLGVGKREIIAAYGAGGKTTLLNRLAVEIEEAGGSVILTTTTKIYPPKGIPLVVNSACDEARRQLEQLLPNHPVVCLGKSLLPDGKLVGVAPDLLEGLFRQGIGSHFLVEADGAAGHPIKGYAAYEPVIPATASLLLPVLGLDALGAAVDGRTVHRPELFSLQSGAAPGALLNEDHLSRCLVFMLQAGSAAAPGARLIPVLNKMDLLNDEPSLQKLGTALGEGIKSLEGVDRMVFSALREAVAVKFVLRRSGAKEGCKVILHDQQSFAFAPAVSCVILAAGSSERMGLDKLLLPLGEKTILEHVVDNALQAEGVREIILVTRPRSKKTVTELLRGKNVQLVTNPRYREGMASSLQAGLAAVHPAAQAALFALGDQPFVTPNVYNALTGSYEKNWKTITAPLYRGKRGNPVLLDRRVWPMLMQMRGNAGGRELFSRVAPGRTTLLELDTASILQDIDTPEDYRHVTAGHQQSVPGSRYENTGENI